MEFYTSTGSPLPYDPISTHGIPVADLEACAKKQGVKFRQADILLLRIGFIQKYMSLSQTAKDELGGKPETLSVQIYFFGFRVLSTLQIFRAGIEQSEDMKRFLW